jgi:hypothetical protein
MLDIHNCKYNGAANNTNHTSAYSFLFFQVVSMPWLPFVTCKLLVEHDEIQHLLNVNYSKHTLQIFCDILTQ